MALGDTTLPNRQVRNGWRMGVLAGAIVGLGLMGARPTMAAFDNFDGYDAGSGGNGSTYGNNGGSAATVDRGVAWSGAWGEGGSFQSAAVNNFALGTPPGVAGISSTSPAAEYTLSGGNVLDAIRGFTSLSGTTAWVYGFVALGKSGGPNLTDSFGGIGLYQGTTEKFLIGERYQATNWGATAGSALNSAGQNSSVAIGNFSDALLVAKIDQPNHTLTLFVNPDLTQTEAQNTAAFSLDFGTNNSTIDTLHIRGGNPGSGNTWQYDNINVATATPFAVPEPGSVLLLGGLTTAAILPATRRQKRRPSGQLFRMKF